MPLKKSDDSEDNKNNANKNSEHEKEGRREKTIRKTRSQAKKTKKQQPQEDEKAQIDFSSLSDEEADELILEMQAEEIMERQEREEKKTKKRKVKRRKRKKSPQTGKHLAPGFEWVAIKMGVAMTFTFVFIFLGPLFIFMALVKGFGDRGTYDLWDLVFGIIGIGLIVAAYYLFKYFISD
ncbi:MAG: hypothetical protein GF308_04470 [Candidatus Heimdallarchaeota archaeon]|nr:hypothetical protein [Candidatus Heimdallarchaeota archaeon]